MPCSTRCAPAPYGTSYTYAAAGSRQQETVHEVDGDEDLLGTCIYPDGNQQKTLTETETETTGPDAQTTTQRYAYHKAGNTIRPGDTAEQHLTWNAEGPAAGLDESGGRTYRPLRDPRRRRRRRVTGPPSANLTV